MQVKFGTDGWRAVIAKDFTFDNLKLAALSTAEYFLDHPNRENGVCIGYDTRFMSPEFAEYAADILSSRGLRVFLSDSFVPSPAVSLYCRDRQLAGGIMITASHNPPTYNGFKVKASYGGSALPETITEIERNLAAANSQRPVKPEKKLIEKTDVKSFYLEHIKKHINLDTIRKSRIKIVHNAMFGAGQHIITRILDKSVVACYHCSLNPGFEGINPEPIPRYIEDFIDFLRQYKPMLPLLMTGMPTG